jgi:hypothetical protein
MLAVALSSLLVIESVTYRIRRRPTRRDLDKDVRAALMSLQRRLAQSADNAEPAPARLKVRPPRQESRLGTSRRDLHTRARWPCSTV